MANANSLKQFKNIQFPVYRKYKNGKSWFRVNGADSFDEVRMIGSMYVLSKHVATVFPDRNFILDLVFNYSDFAEEITAPEFEMIAGKSV